LGTALQHLLERSFLLELHIFAKLGDELLRPFIHISQLWRRSNDRFPCVLNTVYALAPFGQTPFVNHLFTFTCFCARVQSASVHRGSRPLKELVYVYSSEVHLMGLAVVVTAVMVMLAVGVGGSRERVALEGEKEAKGTQGSEAASGGCDDFGGHELVKFGLEREVEALPGLS
ncbi:hypothetical protein F2P56_015900, partial [Juglans regia]